MANERTKRIRTYSDVEMVMGIQSKIPSLKSAMEKALYTQCKRYYNENHWALFKVDKETEEDIFHNSFIVLWQNIEKEIVSVKDGILMGKDGEPFKATLTTYLMDIAKRKYQEWKREDDKVHPKVPKLTSPEEETQPTQPTPSLKEINRHIKRWFVYGNEEQMKLAIISDYIGKMTERCLEILSRFLYEEKKYETILLELPTYSSIDALKTQKYKCMQRLKIVSTELYNKLNPKI